MKFTTAVMALTAASAHNPHCTDKHHCSKNWKVYTIDWLYHPLTGSHIE
jgi:hypothetical protein